VLLHWLSEISIGRLHVPKGEDSLMEFVSSLVNQLIYAKPLILDELAEYRDLAHRAKDTFENGASGARADQELARQLAADIRRMEYIWEFFLTDDEKTMLVDAGYWAAGDVKIAMRMRDEVHQFAQLMEVKMRKHDPSTRWKKSKRQDLLLALEKELEKLRPLVKYEAINEKSIAPEEIASQAADVANFAMMIADVCGGLRWITEKSTPTKKAERIPLNVSPPASGSKTTPVVQQS